MMPGDDGYGFPPTAHPGREAFAIVLALGFIIVVLGAAIWALSEAWR